MTPRLTLTAMLHTIIFGVIIATLSGCERESLQQQCANMVKHEKRRMPRNVAQGLVLDSMKYSIADNTITYYHTMSDSLYSDEAISRGRNQLQLQLTQDISNSVGLRRLKEEGVSFKYVYTSDRSKKVRFTLHISNKDLR